MICCEVRRCIAARVRVRRVEFSHKKMPLYKLKESPEERIDTAHAGARALQIVAHCVHHGPNHNSIHEAADAEH